MPKTNGEVGEAVGLVETLAVVAARLGSFDFRTASDGTEYRRANRAFALVDLNGRWASFRLSTAVASAAIRTPDTTPSDRGSGWVTLEPAALDGNAIDRAVAWFESAWRLAGSAGS